MSREIALVIANRLGEILPALNECVSKIAASTERFAIEVGTERALVRQAVADLDDAPIADPGVLLPVCGVGVNGRRSSQQSVRHPREHRRHGRSL